MPLTSKELCEVSVEQEGYAIIKLNDSSCKNALSQELILELSKILQTLDQDASIKCALLKGEENFFSVGAHLQELLEYATLNQQQDILDEWECVARFSKPLIVLIEGYCLGGGLEIALMGDILLASEEAIFAQPEISLNLLPGAGGTQRLGKSLTKTQAMDICLTGRLFKACEALELGIISKIFPKEALLGHAKEMAKSLALRDLKALQRIKAAVLKAHETPLCQGVRFERELFYSQLKSETGKQGITDFFAKKKK